MANIIPCDLIQQEVERLKNLFEPCYALKAEDLDALVCLINSVSLCGVEDQNNTIPTIITNASRSGTQDVAAAVNGSSQFEVLETEILHVVNSYQELSTSNTVNFITDYYFLTLGKGVYGQGGTTVVDQSSFILIRRNTDLTISSQTVGSSVVFNIDTNSILTPINDIVDGSLTENSELFNVGPDDDVYFFVRETLGSPSASPGGAVTLTNNRQIYRFLGGEGIYGMGSGVNTLFSDYLLVEDLTGSNAAPSGGISVQDFQSLQNEVNLNTTAISDITNNQSIIDTAQDTLINSKVNTTDLPELVQDLLGSSIVDGTNINTVYDDVAGTLTINANIPAGLGQEDVEDIVGNLIVSGTGINSIYDDTTGSITISLSGQEFTLAQASEVSANTLKRSYPLADETKLLGIEAGATGDQTASEVPLVDIMGNWTSNNLEDLSEEISMRILGVPSTTIDNISFIPTGVQNQYNISVEWTDGDGVTNTSTTNTPFTIDDANFVNLTTNQTINGQKVFSMNIETTGVQITGGTNDNILLDGGNTIPITDLQLEGYQEEGGDPSDNTFQVTVGDHNQDNTGFNLRLRTGDRELIAGDIYENENGTLFKLNDVDQRIQLGDPEDLSFGLVLDIDGQTRRVLLGANGNNSNGTSITINDANGAESIILSANNGFFVSDDLSIGSFGNRTTISTNPTAPNIDLTLPSETGTIALVGDVETIDLIDNSDDTFTFTNSLGTTTTFDAKTSPFDNSDGSTATETSAEINFNGNIGLGITVPAFQLDVSEDIRVNGVEIGTGGNDINTNTRIGRFALELNTTGESNTALGDGSLRFNTEGDSNTASGRNSLRDNISGFQNTGTGISSLRSNETGDNNTVNGAFAMQNNVSGSDNTVSGRTAFNFNVDGSENVAIGRDAGNRVFPYTNTDENTNATRSIYIGYEAFPRDNNGFNEIVIGATTNGRGSNTVTIGNGAITDNYFIGNIHAGAYLVTSDSRSKRNLIPTNIFKNVAGTQVQVYSFKYTFNGDEQIGVIAQDVRAALLAAGISNSQIDIAVPRKEGINWNATLANLNTKFSGTETTITAAKAAYLDSAVKQDLEAKGFPEITRFDAMIEFENLEQQNFESLTPSQQDRLTRFRSVDFSGNKIFKEEYVNEVDICSINTSALQWFL